MTLVPDLHPLLLGITWMDPEWLLQQFGGAFIWISLAIVFVECGLFFPFLPGDTLLFALGLFISGSKITILGVGTPGVELALALLLLTVAAFLGNVVGYEIGRKLGDPVRQHDGRILKRSYIDKTDAFFARHGSKALVLGRFVPFVRTYITLVAGITEMNRRKFFTWSAVGALLWVLSITLMGYFLGRSFPAIGQNIDYAMIAILVFTVVPLAYEGWKHRGHGDDGQSSTDSSAAGAASGEH